MDLAGRVALVVPVDMDLAGRVDPADRVDWVVPAGSAHMTGMTTGTTSAATVIRAGGDRVVVEVRVVGVRVVGVLSDAVQAVVRGAGRRGGHGSVI
jgi:hypothetical protein